MTTVITYQTSRMGESINLTPKQCAILTGAGKWPRNDRGEEYATVSHGAHYGRPTCDSLELSDLVNCG